MRLGAGVVAEMREQCLDTHKWKHCLPGPALLLTLLTLSSTGAHVAGVRTPWTWYLVTSPVFSLFLVNIQCNGNPVGLKCEADGKWYLYPDNWGAS